MPVVPNDVALAVEIRDTRILPQTALGEEAGRDIATEVGTGCRCELWRVSASTPGAFDIRSVVRARMGCASWGHDAEYGGPTEYFS